MSVSKERIVSLWMNTEVAPAATALGEDETADVVIVGSGIAGLWPLMSSAGVARMWSSSTAGQSARDDVPYHRPFGCDPFKGHEQARCLRYPNQGTSIRSNICAI